MPEIALTGLGAAQIRQLAKTSAREVASLHWPDATLPRDPVRIARNLGVEVFSADLGNDAIGMIVSGQTGTSIYADRDQPPNRYRFTVAHEIGHYMHRPEGAAYVDKRSDQDRGRSEEIFANEFAGELLMPEAALQRFIEAGASNPEMASWFGVSLDALKYRRYVLGV